MCGHDILNIYYTFINFFINESFSGKKVVFTTGYIYKIWNSQVVWSLPRCCDSIYNTCCMAYSVEEKKINQMHGE